MTDIQRDEIRRKLQEQKEASSASPAAAREALMKTGMYNADGTLKPAHGGKKA